MMGGTTDVREKGEKGENDVAMGFEVSVKIIIFTIDSKQSISSVSPFLLHSHLRKSRSFALALFLGLSVCLQDSAQRGEALVIGATISFLF
ncbi:hypothetical protein SAY86_015828 [Trapa natans]|uniref:Uncharacterized protein n=1 Tax=Trapa natans TaxID=22666 RepID=A0AAN7QYW7_TRANT|nr:hypothetical protein SAY86_015828 [Trapa natans]